MGESTRHKWVKECVAGSVGLSRPLTGSGDSSPLAWLSASYIEPVGTSSGHTML
ncbi:hypothetical protein DPMN_072865 [Dreissena polymorpha]|uniref:Uncharacterized protein n=1 Tax=Dreissena polymorpha TaxID=45954 RepID=A0A9D4HCC6_DREPO|nr:hypothetical protein DPMN_072865 [Dreissena polymorpha]